MLQPGCEAPEGQSAGQRWKHGRWLAEQLPCHDGPRVSGVRPRPCSEWWLLLVLVSVHGVCVHRYIRHAPAVCAHREGKHLFCTDHSLAQPVRAALDAGCDLAFVAAFPHTAEPSERRVVLSPRAGQELRVVCILSFP